MKVLCVHRAERYSPNRISDDEAIINAVALRLKSAGHEVEHSNEIALTQNTYDPDMVMSMGRCHSTLTILSQMEKRGVVVVNSTDGVKNCGRMQFTCSFLNNSIPMPDSSVVMLNERPDVSSFQYPCWIKKGDGCAEIKDDVVFVASEQEAEEVLEFMKCRNIQCVTVSSHVEGDLIKFYGISGTDFFRWYYVSGGDGKFGHEQLNGKSSGLDFSAQELQRICERAAHVLGIDIYGGDCIVNNKNEIKIIDFNDWPSFSRCRDDAADAILKSIENKNGKRY